MDIKLESLIERATQYENQTVAVAVAEDEEVIEAMIGALHYNLSKFLLFGDSKKIVKLIEGKAPELIRSEKITIVHTNTSLEAVEQAVKSIRLHEANVLMKGNIPTATLLKAVLNKENGLRISAVISHVAVFEVPGFDRLTIVTDAAMNIAPDLDTKAKIIANSVQVATSIGIINPLVAPIAAVEYVNPAMQATIDAALLTQMNKRGQITDCVVDGPLALDNAISLVAAEQKNIQSEVAGRADILLVPTIEVGNTLYKSLVYFAHAKVGAVIAGAKVPIVLTSRADSAESKIYSLALAICSVKKNKNI